MSKRVKVTDTERYGATTNAAAAEAGIDAEDAFQLAGIELACEVADWWAVQRSYNRLIGADGQTVLDRLERATRGSALRKVSP